MEYARGDHFLFVLEIQVVHDVGRSSASPKFPMAWRDEARWGAALVHAEPALVELSALLEPIPRRSTADRRAEQWQADVIAWILNSIGHAVRDGWIHPSLPHRPHVWLPPKNALPDPVDLAEPGATAEVLRAAQIGGGVPYALVTKTFRLLEPKPPEPARRMLLGGHLATEEQTHGSWLRTVLT